VPARDIFQISKFYLKGFFLLPVFRRKKMEGIIQMSAIFEGQLCWRTKMTTMIFKSHHFLIVFK